MKKIDLNKRDINLILYYDDFEIKFNNIFVTFQDLDKKDAKTVFSFTENQEKLLKLLEIKEIKPHSFRSNIISEEASLGDLKDISFEIDV